MAGPITTAEAVRSALMKQGTSVPAEFFDVAYKAAEDFVGARCRWPMDQPAPDALRLAVVLMTARYLARRNSPEGVIGGGDLGPAYVGAADRDVVELMRPWMPVVFG